MHKFYNLKKVKLTLSAVNLIKYTAWCGFFISQGNAIQLAIDNHTQIEPLYKALLLFFATKLIVMLADIVGKFVVNYAENNETLTHWNHHYPQILFQDNESKQHLIYLKYFDHLPALYHIECTVINNQGTIACVFLAVITLLICTGFYFGIVALLTVFFLNFISKNLLLGKLNDCHKAVHDAQSITLKWIEQYFKSYRETSFSWYEQIKGWVESTYTRLYRARKQLIILQLQRDLSAQLLVEIPYIINTCIVILGVYFHYLTVTQLFVWVGLSQFVIGASNAFLENRANQEKKKFLIAKLDEISIQFQDKISQHKNVSGIHKERIEIKLQDNSVNTISLKPGIYHIKGTNGSGKSTLLNSIIGYERRIKVNQFQQLQQLLLSIAPVHIRVIERAPVIFSEFDQFNQQILGPELSKSLQWLCLLSIKTKYLFSSKLRHELLLEFKQVESKFYQRKHKQFSSGERILISFMRTIASWDKDVSILVADECTAFLDAKMRRLFLQCLHELSVRASVFITTHEPMDSYRPAEINLKVVH